MIISIINSISKSSNKDLITYFSESFGNDHMTRKKKFSRGSTGGKEPKSKWSKYIQSQSQSQTQSQKGKELSLHRIKN